MRMRNKKHGAQRIEACGMLLCKEPAQIRENISSPFHNGNGKFHLEIGCGKGRFSCKCAAKNPDVNFYAMERVPNVMVCALENARADEESRNDNLRFIIGNAKNLTEWFAPCSLDCIYLNFSDPWHKERHAKRRLTHTDFLKIYKTLLKPDGIIKFKTDNEKLFDFSLEQFAAENMRIEFVSRDLHSSELAGDNIMTEYEQNFVSQGMKIFSAWVRFQ